MNKIFKLIIISQLIISCSFDNKSGIWDGSKKDKLSKNERDYFKNAKNIFDKKKDNLIIVDKKTDLDKLLSSISKPLNWPDINLNSYNQINNMSYANKNEIKFKSKKISSHELSKDFLYNGEEFIFSDAKGNIIVFSEKKNLVEFKFNFYKNRLKKFSKNLNLGSVENILIVSDNLGYIYAIDTKTKKLIWAKNYGIPFFSNIKIENNKIYATNIDNKIYEINLMNGEKIWEYSTDLSDINTKFKNIISYKDPFLILLNTNGSIYSLDTKNKNPIWFYNVNNILKKKNDIFYALSNIIKDNKVFISSKNSFTVFDLLTGNLLWEKSYNIKLEPIISGSLIILFTEENYLLCLSSLNGEVLWSKDINEKIGKKLKNNEINQMKLINGNVFLFDNQSHLIEIDLKKKKINKVFKSKNYSQSSIINIDGYLYFIAGKKLVKLG